MGRRRGCLWFAAGLLLALLAGVLIFVSVQRATEAPKQVEEPPRVPVVVAARDIPLHTVLRAEDVEVREVPPEMVPEDGLTDASEVVGQLTTAAIARGEIVLRRRLISADYVGPRAAFVMDPKQVMVAFPAADLLTSLGIVRPGDHVDLMFSFDFGKAKDDIVTGVNTLTVLQDLRVAAVIYGEGEGPEGRVVEGPSKPSEPQPSGSPEALLLAVSPQDALLIKYFRDMGAAPDFALRSPAAEGTFDVAPVDGDYLLQNLKIRWRVKE